MPARTSTAGPSNIHVEGSGTLTGGELGGGEETVGGGTYGGKEKVGGGRGTSGGGGEETVGGGLYGGKEKIEGGRGRYGDEANGVGETGVGAGVLLTGGGWDRDATRMMGCAGSGVAPCNAAMEATQKVVATACGNLSQAARVPCQGRHVQVLRSNTIMRMGLTSRDQL